MDIVNNIIEEAKFHLNELREKTYKQIARIFHPDNKETGSEKSFQFIQEIKEYFWDYTGKPRKEIKKWSWDMEKDIAQNGWDSMWRKK